MIFVMYHGKKLVRSHHDAAGMSWILRRLTAMAGIGRGYPSISVPRSPCTPQTTFRWRPSSPPRWQSFFDSPTTKTTGPHVLPRPCSKQNRGALSNLLQMISNNQLLKWIANQWSQTTKDVGSKLARHNVWPFHGVMFISHVSHFKTRAHLPDSHPDSEQEQASNLRIPYFHTTPCLYYMNT